MASSSSSSSSSSCFSVLFCLQLLAALLMFCFSDLCLCFHTKHLSSLSTVGTQWSPAGATWYGSPDGAGSDGGSCGYGGAVAQAPFSSLITSVGPSLYNFGKGCGVCYQVKCTEHPSCSRKPVTVVITDSCLGCTSESAHFDLSGTSFGAMAIPGQEKKLQDAGMLKIQFARVACKYPGKTIAFRVDKGSNSNYFAVVVEFQNGDGDLAGVSLKQEATNIQSGNQWRSLQQSWGADWKLDAGSELHAPFSIRLTSRYSGKTIVAKNVIPVGWKPGAIYRSVVNF